LATAARAADTGAASGEMLAFESTSCARCHGEIGDEMAAPVLALRAGDVHATAGITCADCHGGDPTVPAGEEPDLERAKAPRSKFIGKPRPSQIPSLCGRCHTDGEYMRRFNPNLSTDQLQQYHTSKHGKRLAAGDERAATCVSCHGAHGIQPASDPTSTVYPSKVADTCAKCHSDRALMASFGHQTDPPHDYRNSVHGRAMYEASDLSAPTCNDCHGSHGAAPPGIASIANVCGQCHVTSRDYFAASPHKQAFDAQGLPECTTCHGNHSIQKVSDAMVGSGAGAVCTECHSDGDAGLEAAAAIHSSLDSLATGILTVKDILDRADRAGMEVSDGRIRLQDAHTALVQARDRVHSLAPATVRFAANEGAKAVEEVRNVGVAALRERDVRRRGLGISLVFIALACAGLFLLIRRLDARAGL
jgi:hypothetical protein